MGRPKALDRKQQLLEEILEYLRTRTLSSVTFRTLADALGVSSYVLVYQFGNREALIGDIVREIDYRVTYSGLPNELEVDYAEFEALVERGLGELFTAESRHLLRLQVEAAVLDAVSENPKGNLAQFQHLWSALVVEFVMQLGVSKEDAEALGAGLINTFGGIRLDYVLNGNDAEARRNVAASMKLLRELVVARLGGPEAAEDAMKKRVSVTLDAPALAVAQRPNPAR
ncbi:TetR/AcrR family transcriptional regulator [Falsarthrobacter nasiphocae]|uniref:AcrR family transcriptional regulator n=1 Tax=Falsarthrobacter nasiphocae TaxID=189863 RepID=A0AAE3YGT8_9MICC|nr:TetR/AcrR family transcriptional regulator [Falsarthrobacter nasiphocae]MDR6892457.1 AcrR family transcriptional regulator [Falsarthrobacter nasiphocae]